MARTASWLTNLEFGIITVNSCTRGEEHVMPGDTMPGERRVALISDASFYVGPGLARNPAAKGHDLVLGDPSAELVAELEALGAAVEAVPDARDIAKPDSSARLVEAALSRFGRLDAAAAASGRVITGRFLRSSVDDLQ